ncbi:unnamed protein product (macronuclear) [Paramecium tetraurelia]|uniref:Uncharacterized protein n=1 Tax=Paramecium tetraurelia TaxID=5888 RepID=A0BH62_PARTE|nr:uncharacterized protein GSPATT00028914001 [Paramecium tetraurelia]CAK57879.1 unnamed protein product [Paramecium tetraurelia]|eukprot:XP_001425277.1 hypothetical protein (macronuclear) [Paramecium tetraurelia strain d4-2]
MNIKIVYNSKTHKIAPKLQTLEDIKKAILILYPKQLADGLELYVTLHPEMDPFKILDDSCFLRIQELYHQLNWKSIKFLVKDLINPDLTNEDLQILNQSVIVQSTVQLSTFNNILQQKPQPKQEVIEIKKQILNSIFYSIIKIRIINELQKQEVQELDYESEEFKKFIIDQIDERLKYYGIIENQNKPKVPEYQMQLQTRNLKITKFVNEQFLFQVQVMNTGTAIWKRRDVELIGLSGYYKNISVNLYEDTAPGQIATFKCNAFSPSQPIQNMKNEFQVMLYRLSEQLAYNDGNQRRFFGEIILVEVTSLQNVVIQPNEKNVDQKKVQQLMENAQISRVKAIEFIQFYGVDSGIDEIIMAYFDQLQ